MNLLSVYITRTYQRSISLYGYAFSFATLLKTCPVTRVLREQYIPVSWSKKNHLREVHHAQKNNIYLTSFRKAFQQKETALKYIPSPEMAIVSGTTLTYT